MTFLATLLGAFGGLITNTVTGWQERQTLRAQAEAAIVQAEAAARVEALKAAQMHEANIEALLVQQQDRSWKDEWFTLLLSLPLILAFVGDDGRAIVDAGFKALAAMPDWYAIMVAVAVSAAFGYRKLVDLITSFRGTRR